MKFPILYKHKKIFVWYSGRWVNLSLEATAHGGGFKGYSRFFYHWARCAVGIHRKGSFFGFVEDDNGKIIGCESYRACMYCHGEKEIENATDY